MKLKYQNTTISLLINIILFWCLYFDEVSSRYINFIDQRDNSSNNKAKTIEKIKSALKVYEARIGNKPLELIRLGKSYDGGYIVPVEAMKAADALMGYGIDKDISFEREFSQRLNRPSYGFDCGILGITTGDPNCHFYRECIGSISFLYSNQKFYGIFTTFSEQLERLKLKNKKILLKMDIEGAEFAAMKDVLKYANDITGIVIEIHYEKASFEDALNLLSSLNDQFILLHIHGNNCSACKEDLFTLPMVMELTYINKNLVSDYKIINNKKFPLPIDEPNCMKNKECTFEV